MRVLGSDTSHWGGEIDWHKSTPALGFTYFKATDGLYWIDTQFGSNQDECQDTGLPHAGFHWWQETQDPVGQAEHFIETVGLGYKQYIVDVEPKVITHPYKLKLLLDKCEALSGVKPAIYTSANYWDNFIYPKPDWASQYDLLVAHYTTKRNPTLPVGWSTWKIWQFSDYFYFPGCDEVEDGDWFNGTLEECRAWFGNYHDPLEQDCPPCSGMMEMRVIADKLYIRSGPGTSYGIVGSLLKGDIIEVDDVGGYNAWVKHSKGWSAKSTSGLTYLEKV